MVGPHDAWPYVDAFPARDSIVNATSPRTWFPPYTARSGASPAASAASDAGAAGRPAVHAAQAGAHSERLLAIDEVSLEYRSGARIVRATHQVSFDVYGSDRFVLLGPSGCGKSTLLKAIAGFIEPVSGSIALDGRPVRGPGPDRVVVFQEFDQLPPWKTVVENVAFPLRAAANLSRAEARERALHYLDKVGLSAFADAYPHTLSGGMKQRVAIARALAMQPRVLLMDEPFAALDALTRRKMQEELLRLWDEFRFTLLFVTHSIEEALVVGNRILLLSPHPGRVRAELNSHEHSLDNVDTGDFRDHVARIHRLLFDTDAPHVPTTEDAAS
ncbi:ABC transporter ATP-binding protein [Burkholderia cenocepacia]|uniref:ABC transporter ATP-binding protein n=1 Tax=Burkholderia cenocepacia TaxID=95486 RepID=UPI00078E8C7F|nr:ABC transporter ATP-binding protein [Burkholderia cenocepacia]AMU18838.1 sulfonate ABC transporter ATP-binding protein [Burkholderia cenocepacia]MCW3584600.1 ABC transporter ATP-binding protein [Burkholderia cenocepacia]MCW3629949.1 ABC transporter ATP-binding protein [Burkholderia cenocepacia]MCW3645029.1 ABC transporter ATP-binding protein [Burkholderia cenocepacia]MCW5180726.1 ABC transporter ATP-binding protein [Burkholderia cenocepacia]